MGKVGDQLREHLHPLAGPYLFVGAGLSRRYAGLGDWNGLLAHFASFTDHQFDYYRGATGDDQPAIASLIADAFYDKWWEDPKFKESVATWKASVDSRDSPLKYEVAQYTREAIDKLVLPRELEKEFDLLCSAVVDGVITTNFDRLLEKAFPDFRTFIGQDELLFSDTQGIAEMYYIHGCDKRPESLVLTSTDYADYNARNAYLAAKLATIFVEHPVIFLGYSLSDKNIQKLLESLIAGLRPENVSKLQDRLIFIEWIPDQEAEIASTVMNVGGVTLPIIRATVPDFEEVFQVLGQRERALPARILRVLKEQVFELVRSNDPNGRLVAMSDINSDGDADNFDVVFGVAAKMTAVGLVGLSRWDIVDDLLESPDRELPPDLMVTKALPKQAITTYVPTFKYMVGADLWKNGAWIPKVTVNAAVEKRANNYASTFSSTNTSSTLRTISELEDTRGFEWVLTNALRLPSLTDDADGLLEFLVRHKEKRTRKWSVQYAKAAVAYDWMRFGKGVS